MATVYIIRNTENNKVYIGSTTQPLNKRMVEHRSRAKTGKKRYALYKEMRSVGICKFYIEPLIENVDKDKLFRCEQEQIKMFQPKELLLNTHNGLSYSDIDYIISEYKAGKPIKCIARERGHCSKTVSLILKKFGVEILDWNEKQRIKITSKDLQHLYVDKKMSTPEIAAMYNTSAVTINKHLKKHGILLRKSINRKYLMPSSAEMQR